MYRPRAQTHTNKNIFFFFLYPPRLSVVAVLPNGSRHRAHYQYTRSGARCLRVHSSVLLLACCVSSVRHTDRTPPPPLTHQRRLARARLLHVQIYSEGIRLKKTKKYTSATLLQQLKRQLQQQQRRLLTSLVARHDTRNRAVTFLFHYTITL